MKKIFCDGACLGPTGSPGAWAIQVHFEDGTIKEAGAAVNETTNNRMELTAAIEALKVAGTRAVIYSDSRYVIDNIRSNLDNWVNRQFHNIKNADLWQQLVDLQAFTYEWVWIKGHNGANANTPEEKWLHEAHERVDQLALYLAKGKPVSFYYGKPLKKEEGQDYPCYLVSHDGKIHHFKVWDECRLFVEGKKGIKYQKVKSLLQEQEVLRKWGVKE